MGKSGSLERTQLANQIQEFRNPDSSDACEIKNIYIDLNDLHHQFIVSNGEGLNSNPLDRVVRKNSARKWIINDNNNNSNGSNKDSDKIMMMMVIPCKSAKCFQVI